MRRVASAAVVSLIALGAAWAAPDPSHLSGSHFQFNLIGHPGGGISGDTSNGRAIMIPLRNVTSRGDLVCDVDGVVMADDEAPTYTTSVAAGARLYFSVCNNCTDFQIVDRDATDGRAEIQVPARLLDPVTGALNFDIYMRALGRPNTCMNINAYAFDLDQNLYFWAGSVYISRKAGKSPYVKVNDLFDVHFCQVDTTTGACSAGTIEEISVFADVFEEYFWNILNDGSRNVQVRIYW